MPSWEETRKLVAEKFIRPDQITSDFLEGLGECDLEESSGDGELDEYLRVLGFVHKSITYVDDLGSTGHPEFYRTPSETWEGRQGDCEDQTFLTVSAILFLYTPTGVRVVYGSWENIFHIWAEVKAGDTWYLFDSSKGLYFVLGPDCCTEYPPDYEGLVLLYEC